MNYKRVIKDLLNDLPPRTIGIIERRFGLLNNKRETLEAIGSSYTITRERVRQIELESANKIKPKLEKNKEIFNHFKSTFASFGGVKKEEDLLNYLGDKNGAYFLLSNLSGFRRIPENSDFHTFWVDKSDSFETAKKVIKTTVNNLKKDKELVTLAKLLKGKNIKKDVFLSYIDISKNIGQDYNGNYGLSNWIEIKPKGIKDKAYLVLKKENKPVHFSSVAKMIESLPISTGSIHTATVHNELIKDKRFVLVGRGLYALAEWGYEPGIIKDIIIKTIKESSLPLSKDEILAKVLDQRFVKENTVALNLQNKDCFLRNSFGKYTIKES